MIAISSFQIPIPDSLKDLVKKLAVNFHNQSTIDRINSGYVFGETFDENAKTDPHLCSFIELPQSDQDKFYQSSCQIIASLISLGCRIALTNDSTASANISVS